MQLSKIFLEAMSQCSEGLYVMEEESHKICYVNEFFYEEKGFKQLEGEPCYRALAGKCGPCGCCPELCVPDEAVGEVYAWDYYDAKTGHWYKIKNCLVREDGKLYRVGNVNAIEDMMGLGYDAVKEMAYMTRLAKEKGKKQEKLAYESSHDRLTGLYNRNQYIMDIKETFKNIKRAGILFLDLNNLKEINDKFFHSEGDKLLCRLAEIIFLSVKASGRCYRVGGDEFVIILPDCSKSEMENCRKEILSRASNTQEENMLAISVAIGSAWSTSAENLEALVSEADEKMYRNKKVMKDTRGI